MYATCVSGTIHYTKGGDRYTKNRDESSACFLFFDIQENKLQCRVPWKVAVVLPHHMLDELSKRNRPVSRDAEVGYNGGPTQRKGHRPEVARDQLTPRAQVG